MTRADRGAAPDERAMDDLWVAPVSRQTIATDRTVLTGPTVGDGYADIVVAMGPSGRIQIHDGRTLTAGASFAPFGAGFTGGVRIATGDLNGDGRAEIVVGSGPGGVAQVNVFHGNTFALQRSFIPFASFVGGVSVAVGDVNGDGQSDIIVGAGEGGSPQVRVFDGATGSLLNGFFAFEPDFLGGVNVAAADVDGDGVDEVLVGTASQSSRISVFDGRTGLDAAPSFFGFDAGFTGGVRVAAGDVTGDFADDIIVGTATGSGRVKVFDGKTQAVVDDFFAFTATFAGGVTVAAGDVTGDGRAEIHVGTASGASDVRIYDSATKMQIGAFLAGTAQSGVIVAGADLSGGANFIGNQGGDQYFHSPEEMVWLPTGFTDRPVSTRGNDVFQDGTGVDLFHGFFGVDQVDYFRSLASSFYRDHDTGAPGSVEVFGGLDGVNRHYEIERFSFVGSRGDVEYVTRNPDGAARRTEIDLAGGGDRVRVRTTGTAEVVTVGINAFDPETPAAEDAVLIKRVGVLDLRLRDGANNVLIDGGLANAGVHMIRIDATGADGDSLQATTNADAAVTIAPNGADGLLARFGFAGAGGATALTSLLARDVEVVGIIAPNAPRLTVTGDLTPTGLGPHTLTLTGGVGANALDASGVTSGQLIILNGLGGNDTIRGGIGSDVLNGGDGLDTVQGGPGRDIIDGGGATDSIDYREKTASVVLALNGAASATAFVGGVAEDTVRNVEQIFGGSGSDTFTGDAGNNFINGFAGNDYLKGGPGRDTLLGSLGLDIADYRDKSDPISLTLNGSAIIAVNVGGVAEDQIQSIEAVYGGSGADIVTGDSLGNSLRGGGGADVFDGMGGVDSIDFRDKSTPVMLALNGGTFATATIGGVTEDRVRNVEVVYGGSTGDVLVGDGFANQLFGGGGADTLRGLGGRDLLTGGAGNDLFVYNSLAESTVAASGRDVIVDFVSGTDDIRLTLIDANTAQAGDQAFVLGSLVAGSPGRLNIVAGAAGEWLVRGDVNGDGVADLAISVMSPVAPGAGDFQL